MGLFPPTVINVISAVKIYDVQGTITLIKLASIAFVAQSVEQLICNQQVTGSIPAEGSYFILSVRLVVWVGVKTDGSKVSSKPYYPRVAGNR